VSGSLAPCAPNNLHSFVVASALPCGGSDAMRRHHEELLAAPSILPTLSLLIPFAAALWARIKTTPKEHRNTD